MNAFQKSMSEIRATEDLKKSTLQYLEKQQAKKSDARPRRTFQYALAAICLFLLLGTGGYSMYRKPTSYISIDVNPSIELGINRFGKVVSAEAYNEDGQSILQRVSLKNISYIQAINRLLADESDLLYLQDDSLLVFTVISDQSHSILEELRTNEFAQAYKTLMYTSDTACMEEAHSHEMSFGIYRAYLELSQYDSSVTIEDCHDMSIGEIQTRIEGCRHHDDSHGHMNQGQSSQGQNNQDPSSQGQDDQEQNSQEQNNQGQTDQEQSDQGQNDQSQNDQGQTDQGQNGQEQEHHNSHHGGHH
ncbi:MAG: hypothetical protein NC121_01380 [Blautia sp.]|nr:hypothetical protein [Blautia sp.]